MASPARVFDRTTPARRSLERLLRGRAARAARRARIVLLAAGGLSNRAIAKALRVSRPTVILWRARYAQGGAAALLRDAPRSGRPRRIAAGKVDAILRAARETAPVPMARWSVRAMAAAYGLSPASVHRIFRVHGVRPPVGPVFEPTPGEALW